MMTKKAVSIFGLGKVGTAMAVVAMRANYKVYGYDLDTAISSKIGSGSYISTEPFVQSELIRFKKRFIPCATSQQAVNKTNLSILIVPTPSQIDGNFSYQYVLDAILEICNSLIKKQELIKGKIQHSIVIASTVSPETIRQHLDPEMQQIVSKNIDVKVDLVYSPEFIALGNVVNNLEKPEFILIGTKNSEPVNSVLEYKLRVNKNKAKIHLTTWESAEIAKLTVNTFLTTKITYANMVSELITRTKYARHDQVFSVLKDDSRIGVKFFTPGLGYGGPCLPRDNKALISFGNSKKLQTQLAVATDALNDMRISQVNSAIASFATGMKKILILGVTYKSNTNSIEESQAYKIAKIISTYVPDVSIHDFNYDFHDFEAGVKTYRNNIPFETDFDGIICFLNDFRYIEYLKKVEKSKVYLAFDLTLDF
jgi:UDPglucose 6-dehydrogenase